MIQSDIDIQRHVGNLLSAWIWILDHQLIIEKHPQSTYPTYQIHYIGYFRADHKRFALICVWTKHKLRWCRYRSDPMNIITDIHPFTHCHICSLIAQENNLEKSLSNKKTTKDEKKNSYFYVVGHHGFHISPDTIYPECSSRTNSSRNIIFYVILYIK